MNAAEIRGIHAVGAKHDSRLSTGGGTVTLGRLVESEGVPEESGTVDESVGAPAESPGALKLEIRLTDSACHCRRTLLRTSRQPRRPGEPTLDARPAGES